MPKKRKPVKSVNKIKSRGLKKLELGGGENAKAYNDSAYANYDDYHEDLPGYDNRASRTVANNLKGTGMNPPGPQDVKNALRERVSEPEFDKESTRNPIKSYDTPIAYKTMTPMATDNGFTMNMGSKQNFSGSNFSNKDQSTMSAAPSIMKDDWGGETIEMKDQGQKKTSDGSPLNYGKRSQVALQPKNTAAQNMQEAFNTRSEDKRQAFNDVLNGVQTAVNVVEAGAKLSDRRLKKDIKLVSVSPSGLKIYNFKYKDTKFGVGKFQGVMSDEIPNNAVVSHEDGFDRVDYSKLDVEFKAI